MSNANLHPRRADIERVLSTAEALNVLRVSALPGMFVGVVACALLLGQAAMVAVSVLAVAAVVGGRSYNRRHLPGVRRDVATLLANGSITREQYHGLMRRVNTLDSEQPLKQASAGV